MPSLLSKFSLISSLRKPRRKRRPKGEPLTSGCRVRRTDVEDSTITRVLQYHKKRSPKWKVSNSMWCDAMTSDLTSEITKALHWNCLNAGMVYNKVFDCIVTPWRLFNIRQERSFKKTCQASISPVPRAKARGIPPPSVEYSSPLPLDVVLEKGAIASHQNSFCNGFWRKESLK